MNFSITQPKEQDPFISAAYPNRLGGPYEIHPNANFTTLL
jgi:hypothetical protein